MKPSKSRFLPVFYLLLAYLLLQFSWWAYSIAQLNAEIISLKIELAQTNGAAPEKISEINNTLDKKLWMVSGEGTVFLILLLAGAFYIRRSFKKEILLRNQQKNFMLSVTHELKSPLSSIKLYLQTLIKRDLPPEKQKEITRHALADSDRLAILIDNILTASRIESGRFELHPQKENLGIFVQKLALQHFQPGLGTHKLYTEIASDIELKFDSMALSIIIGNLLDNATKYSPQQTTISVLLKKTATETTLQIADQGNGIPAAERQKIFDKFYRIGNEDTRKAKGTGLGLYIVKTLADLSRITISVADNEKGGSTFTLHFQQ